ncbi:hypothetical protein ACP4OV_013138 [Aristida adscensionis]
MGGEVSSFLGCGGRSAHPGWWIAWVFAISLLLIGRFAEDQESTGASFACFDNQQRDDLYHCMFGKPSSGVDDVSATGGRGPRRCHREMRCAMPSRLEADISRG